MTGRSRAIVVGILLGLALTFRLVLALGFPSDEPEDSAYYELAARNILQHGTYSGDDGPPYAPTYVRVPGYSIFIAAVYGVFGADNHRAVRVAQAVVETGTCWIIALLALALAPRDWAPARRRRAQTTALALAVACPFTAIYVVTILTEALAIGLGAALAWCAMRGLNEDASPEAGQAWRSRRWWLGAGLAGGALTLVRPEGAVMTAGAGAALVLVGCWRVWRARQPWRAGASRLLTASLMLCAGFLAFDGTWTLRNYLVFGDFQPLNPRSLSMPGGYEFTGYNRWLRTWLDDPKHIGPFYFDLDRVRYQVDQFPPSAIDTADERRLLSELLTLYNGPSTPASAGAAADEKPAGLTEDLDRRFGALADARIARHPIRFYLWLPAQRLFWIWAGPHAQYYPFDGDLLPLKDLDTRTYQHVWLPLFAFLIALWTVFGVMGSLALALRSTATAGLVLVVLINAPRLALLGSMENPEPRYTVELFPFLSALGGVAIGWLWPSRRDSADGV